MAIDDLYTRGDLIAFLVDQDQVTSDRALRLLRTACRDAYRSIPKLHDWKYLRRQFVFLTNAPYSTGSIAYTHSTRTMTLTDGTWPSWAGSGWVRITNVSYRVERRVSNSQLILDVDAEPGQDIASGTGYQLFQQDYEIPRNIGQIHRVSSNSGPRELFPIDLSIQPSPYIGMAAPGLSQWYATVGLSGDGNIGRRALRLSPPPSDAKNISLQYDARPRDWGLTTTFKTGTVSVTADSTTVTLTDGVWPTACSGCLLRMTDPAGMVIEPTSPEGDAPAAFAGIVRSRTSDTVVELWNAADASYSGVCFTLDDPLDIEPSAMWPWLRAEARARFLELTSETPEVVARARAMARDLLAKAREADNSALQPVDMSRMGDPVLNGILSSFIFPTYIPST